MVGRSVNTKPKYFKVGPTGEKRTMWNSFKGVTIYRYIGILRYHFAHSIYRYA